MSDRYRTENQIAFVLHTYPYSETSLLLDLFSRRLGRLALVAKGARRPRSELRGVLLAFQPLSVSWSGRGEVRTLRRAEWIGGIPLPRGEHLLCGFYANELLMRLLARDDPHEALFDDYVNLVEALAGGADTEASLRSFEKCLLRELGYGLTLDRTIAGDPIASAGRYAYDPERGPVLIESKDAHALAVAGKTLLDLDADRFDDPQTRLEAKLLMRTIINFRLDARPLLSRQVIQDLHHA